MQLTFRPFKRKKLDMDAKIDRAFNIANFFCAIMIVIFYIILITPMSHWQHNQLNSLPTKTVLYSC